MVEPTGGNQAPQLPKCLQWHMVFAILGGCGMAIVYGLKVNLSVAIVAMINQTHAAEEKAEASTILHHHSGFGNETFTFNLTGDECFNPSAGHNGSHSKEDGPFTWTEPQQGLVLGSYFWGYFVTQIPGGRFSEMYSGKWIFFGAVILNIATTLLTPVCSYAGYEYLIVMRVLAGFGGGVTFPALNVLIARWAPMDKRSTVAAIAFGGTALGTVISLPTSGIIAGNLGWEAVFYIHGGLSALWCILWAVFVTDTPDEHRFITTAEKDYIKAGSGSGSEASVGAHGGGSIKVAGPIPWMKILTSGPVWAIIISHTLNNFGWYMFLVELPSFMRNGLGFNIQENAGLSCIPFLASWIFSIIYSNILDRVHHHKLISITNGRKISMAIASVIPAGCLIGVCLSGCNRTSVVTLMIIATLFYGSMFSGVFSNHVDIACNYAGLLMAISNMVATIPGFVVPAFVGSVTHGVSGIGPWHTVFYTTAGLLLLEFVLYSLLASGVEQPWNKQPVVIAAVTEEQQQQQQEQELCRKVVAKPQNGKIMRISHSCSFEHGSQVLRSHEGHHGHHHFWNAHWHDGKKEEVKFEM